MGRMTMRGFVADLATTTPLAPIWLAAFLLGTPPATASEAVVGDDSTHACFEASISKRADTDAVQVCDLALTGDVLTPEERGGALVNRGVIRMRRGELTLAENDFNIA